LAAATLSVALLRGATDEFEALIHHYQAFFGTDFLHIRYVVFADERLQEAFINDGYFE